MIQVYIVDDHPLFIDALLVKHCGKQELVETIQAVINNERIAGKNTICLSNPTASNDPHKQYALTYRELQILNFLEKNYNRELVSKTLGISKSTIDFHCRSIFKKFDKSNLNSVLEEARKADIIANFIPSD